MGTSDISRNIFDKKKNYRSVRNQQGRVLTDDDWNENERIHVETDRGANVDVIGPHGSPDEGFKIEGVSVITKDTKDYIEFKIHEGTYYLGGLRLDLHSPETFLTQKDWLQQDISDYEVPNLAADDTRYDLVYLEAWQQPVTAVEDAELFEAALGGTDTTTRIRNMARVKLYTKQGLSEYNCKSYWEDLIGSIKGTTNAEISEQQELIPKTTLKVTYSDEGESNDLCSSSIGGDYLGAENQAIRVQLTGDNKFTWGFDNASSLYRIELSDSSKSLDTFKLITAPKDEHHWPLAGKVVEILPWSAILANREKTAELTGHFSKVKTSYDPDTSELTIEDPLISADFGKEWTNRSDSAEIGQPTEYLFMRVWDRGSDLTSDPNIAIDGPKIPLGNTGILVTISGAYQQEGDYWIIAARPETPGQVVPWELEIQNGIFPHGIRRYFAPLAILEWTTDADGKVTGKVFHDCRKHFPSLTEMTNLYYVSGDGQEAMPGAQDPLPEPLRVRVSNGTLPVKEAKIEFNVLDNEAIIDTAVEPTDNHGIASFEWTIGDLKEPRVKAYLLDKAGNRLEDKCIIFTANLSKAEKVWFDSSPGKCAKWVNSPSTVQAAIDELCKRESGGGCRVTVGRGGEHPSLDVAIYELLRQNKTDICLCMLPGEQESKTGDGFENIANLIGELSAKDEGLRINLKVVGCGPGTRVIVNAPLLFRGFSSVIIRDLDIAVYKFDDFTSNGDRPYGLSFEKIGEVSLSGCYIWGYSENKDDPFILIKDVNKIYLENNLIERYSENITTEPSTIFKQVQEFQPLFSAIKSEYLPDAPVIYSIRDYEKITMTLAQEIAGSDVDVRKDISSNIRKNAENLQEGNTKKAYIDLADAIALENIDIAALESILQSRIQDTRKKTITMNTGCVLTIFCNAGKIIVLNNSIYGLITLNAFANELLTLNKEGQRELAKRVQNEIPLIHEDCAQLDLINNKLTGIKTLSDSSFKTLIDQKSINEGVYRMNIRGNSFLDADTVLLTEYLNIDCNYFEEYQNTGKPTTIVTAIAHSAVYMGNQAREPNAKIKNITFSSTDSANLPTGLLS